MIVYTCYLINWIPSAILGNMRLIILCFLRVIVYTCYFMLSPQVCLALLVHNLYPRCDKLTARAIELSVSFLGILEFIKDIGAILPLHIVPI